MSYLRNLGIALDQLLNVALKPVGLGSGAPDETLSAYWGRTREGRKVSDLASRFLDRLDRDHAFDAIELDPRTGAEEPHHLGDYEERRKAEEDALKRGLASEYPLDDATMQLAEMAAYRQRLRERARDAAERRRR